MLYLLKEITPIQADLIKSFAIFYMLLVVNYLGNTLFSCYQINYIKSNKWFQFTLSFFLFYFFVLLVSNTGNLEFTPPIERLISCFFYFIGFLFVMRLDMTINLVVLGLIFMIYFIELNKEFYLDRGKEIKDPEEKDIYNNNRFWITMNWPYRVRLFPVHNDMFVSINKAETILYYMIIGLLIIGVISYAGEIHDTVKNSNHLTWIDVITDTEICKLKNRKSLWHYLKVGIGMKL
jgi:hypothetical protein